MCIYIYIYAYTQTSKQEPTWAMKVFFRPQCRGVIIASLLCYFDLLLNWGLELKAFLNKNQGGAMCDIDKGLRRWNDQNPRHLFRFIAKLSRLCIRSAPSCWILASQRSWPVVHVKLHFCRPELWMYAFAFGHACVCIHKAIRGRSRDVWFSTFSSRLAHLRFQVITHM